MKKGYLFDRRVRSANETGRLETDRFEKKSFESLRINRRKCDFNTIGKLKY